MTSPRERLQQVWEARRRWVVVEGDCREVLRELWASTAQLLLTDVPYGVSKEGAEITRKDAAPLRQDFGAWDRLPEAELATLVREMLRAASLPVDGNGAAYVFTSDVIFGTVRAALAEDFGAVRRGFFTWCKTNPAPSMREAGWLSAAELLCWGRRPGNRFAYPGHSSAYNWMRLPAPPGVHRRHPTQKPLKLLERIISAQTREGDLVLDPFCGSASTGEACLRLRRRFIGIELDPQHAAKAHDWLTLLEQGAVAAGAGSAVAAAAGQGA